MIDVTFHLTELLYKTRLLLATLYQLHFSPSGSVTAKATRGGQKVLSLT